MKLCVDCKHCVVDVDEIGERHFCGHQQMLSKVNGKPDQSCALTRSLGENSCGGPGRLWEKK